MQAQNYIELTGELDPHEIAEAFAKMEKQNVRVKHLVMNQETYKTFLQTFLRHIQTESMKFTITNEPLSFWGSELEVNEFIPPNVILFLPDHQFAGNKAVRFTITGMPKQKNLYDYIKESD